MASWIIYYFPKLSRPEIGIEEFARSIFGRLPSPLSLAAESTYDYIYESFLLSVIGLVYIVDVAM
ncbi:unnamed protein product [Leptidea sinapis]|uniref:Uncharacterized protein n=1 Tax=Leptidea sinapis TaxID=189913 RepID=A0A5E4Q5W0_9NEOP|nr:unnamed protein product [Leptidea sinapis]